MDVRGGNQVWWGGQELQKVRVSIIMHVCIYLCIYYMVYVFMLYVVLIRVCIMYNTVHVQRPSGITIIQVNTYISVVHSSWVLRMRSSLGVELR
jgi:hypothetical protein